MAFTQNKDADRLILQELDDRDLFSTILANKYVSTLPNENFWRNRLFKRYPSSLGYKKENQTWREYYLSLISLIDNIKRKYKFEYTRGNPEFVLEMLEGMPHYEMDTVKRLYEEGYDNLALYIWNQIRRPYGYPPLTKEGAEPLRRKVFNI